MQATGRSCRYCALRHKFLLYKRGSVFARNALDIEGKKPCRRCALEIPVPARRCSHCGAEQDWRRHLAFSNTSLSLLVALVAVSTPLAVLVKDSLSVDYGSVQVEYLSSSVQSSAQSSVSVANVTLGVTHTGTANVPIVLTGFLIDAKEDAVTDEDFLGTVSIMFELAELFEAPQQGSSTVNLPLLTDGQCPIFRIVPNRDFQNDSLEGVPLFEVLAETLAFSGSECSLSYQYSTGDGYSQGVQIRSCQLPKKFLTNVLQYCTDDRIWRY